MLYGDLCVSKCGVRDGFCTVYYEKKCLSEEKCVAGFFLILFDKNSKRATRQNINWFQILTSTTAYL